MRVFIQRSLAFSSVCFAAILPGRLLAQDSAPSANAPIAEEQPETVTVRGRKTMTQYRLELERARDEIFRIFNEANEGDDTDMRCRDEQPTGSRVRHTVCRSNAENRATREAGQNFLQSLFSSSGGFITNTRGAPPPPGGTQLNANVGTGRSQQDGESGGASALQQWEAEWQRLLADNRDLYRAVTTYTEIEAEYARARGDTTGLTEQDLTVVLEEAPAQTNGPVCEASTLTEFEQRNNVARVSGTVSISSCPAGTTGSFTLVARVRDDAGDMRPVEFMETWQRADAQDHVFNSDYPIGDNVFLVSVRVRDLACTCAGAAQ